MIRRKRDFIADFFKLESASGIILMFAAVLAVICANTPLRALYDLLLDIPVENLCCCGLMMD